MRAYPLICYEMHNMGGRRREEKKKGGAFFFPSCLLSVCLSTTYHGTVHVQYPPIPYGAQKNEKGFYYKILHILESLFCA